MKIKDEVLQERKTVSIDLSSKIESTLKKFNIEGKIASVTFNEDEIFLELRISSVTRVEEIKRLNKTLAMAISAPTGKIKIEAPIPGADFIGIKIPLKA